MTHIDGIMQNSDAHKQVREALAKHKSVEDQFNRTFSMFTEVKRRNPNHYIKNPNKIQIQTIGKKTYVLETSPKNEMIKKVDSKLKSLRETYKTLIPN